MPQVTIALSLISFLVFFLVFLITFVVLVRRYTPVMAEGLNYHQKMNKPAVFFILIYNIITIASKLASNLSPADAGEMMVAFSFIALCICLLIKSDHPTFLGFRLSSFITVAFTSMVSVALAIESGNGFLQTLLTFLSCAFVFSVTIGLYSLHTNGYEGSYIAGQFHVIRWFSLLISLPDIILDLQYIFYMFRSGSFSLSLIIVALIHILLAGAFYLFFNSMIDPSRARKNTPRSIIVIWSIVLAVALIFAYGASAPIDKDMNGWEDYDYDDDGNIDDKEFSDGWKDYMDDFLN